MQKIFFLVASFFLCAMMLPSFTSATTTGTEKVSVIPCREANEQCWPNAFDITPKGNFFYLERYTGQIRFYKKSNGTDREWYTIENVSTDGEQGGLGLVLDPRFPNKKWVYVYYTQDAPLENKIIRIRKKRNGTFERETLITLPAAYNHNGGIRYKNGGIKGLNFIYS